MAKPRKNTRFDKEPNTNCDYCGVGFFRYPAEKRRYKNSFCSNECMGKWNKENLYSSLNTTCEHCGIKFHRAPSRKKGYSKYFCSNACQGKWKAENECGENGYNWQGGLTALRKHELQGSGYRSWRKEVLQGAICIFCDSGYKLELHHIESRKYAPEKIRDESNVIPICAKCHDIFHSNSSKGDELRGTLKAILAHGNPQPSQSNVVSIVGWKVQRLTGEETTTNKPDTSVAPERDDIVWTA